MPPITGNSASGEEAFTRNRFNADNNSIFIQSNGDIDMQGSLGEDDENGDGETFGFMIPVEESESLGKQQLKARRGAGRWQPESNSRSQLIQRKGGRGGEGNRMMLESELLFGAPADQAVNGRFIQQNNEDPFEQTEDLSGDGAMQQHQQEAQPLIVAAAAAPRSTGLLSLRFEIPTDGQRYDFVRPGGNAQLTLNVRSAESRQWLFGVLWALACLAAAVFVLRSLSGRRMLNRFLLIGATAGLAGWFLFPGSSAAWALAIGVGSIIALCGMAIARTWHEPQVAA